MWFRLWEVLLIHIFCIWFLIMIHESCGLCWYLCDYMISCQWCNLSASSSTGTKRTNCFLASAVLADHKLWCLHRCCQVIVCTWDFLLQQLMRLKPIVVSLFSITHGIIVTSTHLQNFYAVIYLFSLTLCFFIKIQCLPIRICHTLSEVC
jgi:hypothetical protein